MASPFDWRVADGAKEGLEVGKKNQIDHPYPILANRSDHGNDPQLPVPTNTPYAYGSISPSLWPQEELERQVQEYYLQWKERHLKTVLGTHPEEKFVHWNIPFREWVVEGSITVSEAHGYGMIALAFMAGFDPDAQSDFDAMFRFFRSHPSQLTPELMSWIIMGTVDRDGNAIHVDSSHDSTNAIDGDLDIAYALLLADNQWGSDGVIDYRNEALSILHAILERSVSPEYHFIQLGDWVRRSPRYGGITRSSDFMLTHVYAFMDVDSQNRERWKAIYERSLDICLDTYPTWTPNTGLMPDFLERQNDGSFHPVQGQILESPYDGDYNFNACRIPWRLGLSYLLLHEFRLFPMMNQMNQWIQHTTQGDPMRIHPGYYVGSGTEGTPIPRDWSQANMSFIAPFAVSAMVSISGENQQWLDALWKAVISDSWEDGIPFDGSEYYPNTIRLLVMIAVSGNWWLPR